MRHLDPGTFTIFLCVPCVSETSFQEVVRALVPETRDCTIGSLYQCTQFEL